MSYLWVIIQIRPNRFEQWFEWDKFVPTRSEPYRRLRLGALHETADRKDTKQRVRELTDGRGADVVVDVSSYATDPVAESLDYVAPGGTIVLDTRSMFSPMHGALCVVRSVCCTALVRTGGRTGRTVRPLWFGV